MALETSMLITKGSGFIEHTFSTFYWTHFFYLNILRVFWHLNACIVWMMGGILQICYEFIIIYASLGWRMYPQ